MTQLIRIGFEGWQSHLESFCGRPRAPRGDISWRPARTLPNLHASFSQVEIMLNAQITSKASSASSTLKRDASLSMFVTDLRHWSATAISACATELGVKDRSVDNRFASSVISISALLMSVKTCIVCGSLFLANRQWDQWSIHGISRLISVISLSCFHPESVPIGSMYGIYRYMYIYANIWGILMVNVSIYTIHGSYIICKSLPQKRTETDRCCRTVGPSWLQRNRGHLGFSNLRVMRAERPGHSQVIGSIWFDRITWSQTNALVDQQPVRLATKEEVISDSISWISVSSEM